MLKVGDTVAYVGPVEAYMGRYCGKVIEVKNEHVAVVKWPGLSEPRSNSISSLSITNHAQSEPTTIGQGDSVRKPHTCNKGANNMNALEQEIIIKLVDNNEGRPDDLNGCGIFCHNVPCYLCPVNINKKITLGEIRAMDIRKPKLEKPEVTTTEDQPYAKAIDDVRKPSHYQVFDGVESIEIIARSLTVSEFRGFCMGNVLKYRLRAGKKSELATMEKDLNKAAFYQELFDLHKGKCYAAE